MKSINYDGLMPVLVEAIKDLKAQVDSLISNSASQRLMNDGSTLENQNTKSEVGNKQKIVLSNQQGIILNQNDPNPFTESTRITFQIPDEVKNAKIIFTSTSGTIINTAIINERGVGELEVYSSELSKGLYNYTLVCDGQVIATKKMVKQ
ncbi:MAG: T9SS type A sorting domain-containing protein [Bacteroidetes bacterium]|nr:T9SS type A sorting domain-containing protein [Bacteroidota bacterium]